MPGRQYSSGSGYRWDFGGHEKIDEVHNSTGTVVDMGDRWLDVRLGRTASIDKMFKKYPSHSGYNYAINNPIFYIDPDGNDKTTYYTIITDQGTSKIKVVDKNIVEFGIAGSYNSAGHKQQEFTAYDVEQYITLDLRESAEKVIDIGPVQKTRDIGLLPGLVQFAKEKELIDQGTSFGIEQGAKEGGRRFLNKALGVSKFGARTVVGAIGFILEPKAAGVEDEAKHSNITLDYPVEKKNDLESGTLYKIEKDVGLDHGTLSNLLEQQESKSQTEEHNE